MRVQPGFVDVVEEGEEREVVPLGDRVELVVVAAGAFQCETKHRGAECVHTIGHVFRAELLLDAAPFVRLPVQTIECRGNTLIARGPGQQVPGQLPGEELVVRQVVVEGANYPVAVRRHIPLDVRLVAIRVGVAREIQPVHCHALAVCP